MAWLSEKDIKKWASHYGFLANIEVTNGSSDIPDKLDQVRKATRYLTEEVLDDHDIAVAGGLLVLKRNVAPASVEDISFLVGLSEYDNDFLDTVVEETIERYDFESEGTNVQDVQKYIYTHSYMKNGNIKKLMAMKSVAEESGKRISFLLNGVNPKIIELMNRRNGNEFPKLKDAQDYCENIGVIKGDILELYIARFFQEKISEGLVFARRGYQFQPKDKPEETIKSDIDVGVICDYDRFIQTLDLMREKGHKVYTRFDY